MQRILLQAIIGIALVLCGSVAFGDDTTLDSAMPGAAAPVPQAGFPSDAQDSGFPDLPSASAPSNAPIDMNDLPSASPPSAPPIDMNDLPNASEPSDAPIDLNDLPSASAPSGPPIDMPDLSAASPSDAVQFDAPVSKFSWGGYFKNETAYRVKAPRSFTKIRNILALNGRYRFNSHFTLNAAGWAYHDLVYDIFDYRTISGRTERERLQPLNFLEGLQQEQDNNVIDLREFYLDANFGSWNVRLGRQFLVWGVMTGVRIVDEVQPMDFRELINLDLLDYRIPTWMGVVDYYGENTSYQFIWSPDVRVHKPAPAGSEWELLEDVTSNVGGPSLNMRPSHRLENSEFGFKISRTVGSTELTASYLYTWDFFPANFRFTPVNAAASGGSINPVFYPSYTRIRMFGSTFQRPFFGQILKGEVAYVKDKFFGLADVDRNHDGYLDHNGELRRDHIRWGLGLDFNAWHTDFSIGVTQWVIFNYDPAMIMDNYDTAVNLFIRKELPASRAILSLLAIVLSNEGDGYVKPKVTFDVTDHFKVGFGMDFFYGSPSRFGVVYQGGDPAQLIEVAQRSSFFGNFTQNDRLFAEFTYAF